MKQRPPLDREFWELAVYLIALGAFALMVTLPSHAQTVTISNVVQDEFDLAVTGSGQVTIALTGGAYFDQFTGVATPDLGGNNDGKQSVAITVTAPASGHVDSDGPLFNGATATVNGVTQTLVQSGATWTTTFGTTPPPPTGTGTATLACIPPLNNTDGSAIVSPISFAFYHGTSSTSLPDKSAAQSSCAYVWQALAAGTHYFAATAIVGGVESGFSNLASKVVGDVPPPPPPPPPPDPCVVTPLAVTAVSWPSARSGARAFRWTSNTNVVAIDYRWPTGGTQTALFTDDRGCTRSVAK